MDEAQSRRIAGLLGPTIIVMIVSEFPLVQPRLYDAQIPPVVYLSGVLMFVAGLAIVRAHNRWRANWTVLVTLVGWFALALGVVRMFAASAYQHSAATVGTPFFMAVETVLLVFGFVMTFKAYVRRDTPPLANEAYLTPLRGTPTNETKNSVRTVIRRSSSIRRLRP